MNKTKLIIILLLFVGKIFANTINDTTLLNDILIKERKTSFFFEKNILNDTFSLIQNNAYNILLNQPEIQIKSNNDGGLQTISFRGSTSSQSRIYWNEIPISNGMNGIFSLSNVYLHNFTDIIINPIGDVNSINYSGGGSVSINNILPKKKLIETSILKGNYGLLKANIEAVIINPKIKQHFSISGISDKANYKYYLNNETKYRNNNNYSNFNINYNVYYLFKNNSITFQNLYSNNNKNLPENIYNTTFVKAYQIDNNLITKIGFNRFSNYYNSKSFLAYQWQRIIFIHPDLKVRSISNSHIFFEQLELSKFIKVNKIHVDLSHKSMFQQFLIESNEYNNRLNINQYNGIFSSDINFKKINISSAFHILNRLKKWNYNTIVNCTFNPFKNTINDIKLGLHFSRAINLPNFNDMYWPISGNKNLSPEYIKTASVKLIHNLNLKQFNHNLNIEIFIKKLENQIIWQPNPILGAGLWSPYNIKSTDVNGISISQNIQLQYHNIQYQLGVAYQYCNAVNATIINETKPYNNFQLIYVPKHKANISNAVLFKKFHLKYLINYVSQRFISNDNNYMLSQYFKHDIFLSKHFTLKNYNFTTTISCTNIFESIIEETSGFPLPLRQFNISIILKI